jgi:glycosyltransferase involved in cell wall biosynthesis
MSKAGHVLINGLSVGGGGGVTVARELANHLAALRPDSRFTVAINPENQLHNELAGGLAGENCKTLPCPGTGGWIARARFEKKQLVQWALDQGVSAVLQLNGMVIPAMPIPTLAHCQNPFPFQPIAWNGWRDRFSSALKRAAQARSLPKAAFVGWTSGYLRDLICSSLRIELPRQEVFYNGLPESWMRSDADSPPISARPMEMVTVSNVAPYKRQDLVIRAMQRLIKQPGLGSLTYRIVGAISPEYRKELMELARSLGLEGRIVIEGRIDDAAVADRFRRARAFVFMSVCESFGIPAIEAMSLGTPVVIAEICALPETCGQAAEYVPPDNLEALAAAVSRVLLDPARSSDLRANGLERIRHFSWKTTAARMADVVDEISSGRGARGSAG